MVQMFFSGFLEHRTKNAHTVQIGTLPVKICQGVVAHDVFENDVGVILHAFLFQLPICSGHRALELKNGHSSHQVSSVVFERWHDVGTHDDMAVDFDRDGRFVLAV